MRMIAKLALSAPFLLSLAACGGAEEPAPVETDAAMTADPMPMDATTPDPMASDAMTDDTMTDGAMTDGAMTDDTMTPAPTDTASPTM